MIGKLPPAKLVAIERGREVRPETLRVDDRPRLLYRGQGFGPLYGVGLREAEARDFGLRTVAIMFDEGKVVKSGTFLYAGDVKCDLCIQQTTVRWGSGDYEDPPELRDDIPGDWFYVWYTPAGARGKFKSWGQCFSTLPEAVEYANRHFSGLKWTD